MYWILLRRDRVIRQPFSERPRGYRIGRHVATALTLCALYASTHGYGHGLADLDTQPLAVNDQATAIPSRPVWLEASFRDGPQYLQIILSGKMGVRVDIQPALPAEEQPAPKTKKRFAFPCSAAEVRWLIGVAKAVTERPYTPRGAEHVILRWQEGQRTKKAKLPVLFGEKGAIAGLIVDLKLLAYVDVINSVIGRAEAEMLAKKGDAARACTTYRQALESFSRWAVWRVLRGRPGLIYEPRNAMAGAIYEHQQGNWTEALEKYREAWLDIVHSELRVKGQGDIAVVEFRPESILSHHVPHKLTEDQIAELRGWEFHESRD